VLKYHPAAGTIVVCDFTTGFRPPEMVKRRPAVIISHRLAFRDRLCTVVPLGQSAPDQKIDYQCQISVKPRLPEPFAAGMFWAKADMLATVSLDRLNFFHTSRDQTGRRRYLQPRLDQAELLRIKACMLHALGMHNLTEYLS